MSKNERLPAGQREGHPVPYLQDSSQCGLSFFP